MTETYQVPTTVADLIGQWNLLPHQAQVRGLTMCEFGEDGEWRAVAGHVPDEEFVAAMREYDQLMGLDLDDGDYEGMEDDVQHLSAALVPWCPHSGDAPERRHPEGCNCEGPSISWARKDGGTEPLTVVCVN